MTAFIIQLEGLRCERYRSQSRFLWFSDDDSCPYIYHRIEEILAERIILESVCHREVGACIIVSDSQFCAGGPPMHGSMLLRAGCSPRALTELILLSSRAGVRGRSGCYLGVVIGNCGTSTLQHRPEDKLLCIPA
eukprot:s1772_g9.t1